MIIKTAGASIVTLLEAGGTLCRVVLNRPKGNVLDRVMIGEIRGAVAKARSAPAVRALLFEGAGPNFSFGASVEEHQREFAAAMLGEFHGLLRDLVDSGLVLLAAIRGQCLGGGLELAATCHRIFAAKEAKLGSPEIKLGVFAPAASYLLPARIGQAHADDLLLSGRSVDVTEALAIGLVDEIAVDPAVAALDWHAKNLVPLSAVAASHAVRAARHRFREGFHDALRALERQYLDELNVTADAREGIAAFLEKRAPSWSHK